MASLFDTETEFKEVVNNSDGDDLQLQDNGSRHLMMAEVHDIRLSDSEPLRRLKRLADRYHNLSPPPVTIKSNQCQLHFEIIKNKTFDVNIFKYL